MGKRALISVLVFFIITAASSVSSARETALRDGFGIAGVDGKLSQDSNDVWFFEPYSNLSDGKGRIRSGASIELLPSSTLGKMIKDAAKRSDKNCKLWGRVTKYKGRNFIFPTYFLPVRKITKPKLQQPQQSQPQQPQKSPPQQTRLTINEPNDVLAMPQEIITKLTARPTATTKRLPAPNRQMSKAASDTPKTANHPASRQDSILADRTGFIYNTGHELIFILDALGRNIQPTSLQLLPCQALEQAQQEQSEELDPLRFKVAGVVTEYKGQNYLLLHRAVRVHSHQNFGR